MPTTVSAKSTTTLLSRGKPANVAQLTDQLRLAVRTGVFRPGQKIPTIRELADETGLTNNVVSRAFENLQAEGLIISRKRAGTFVRADANSNQEHGKRSKMIRIFALVAPELSISYYALLQRGFDRAAGELGYQIVASNTDNDVRYQADTLLQLIDKGVSGVALVPSTLNSSVEHHIRQLQRSRIPVVLLHRPVQSVQAPLLSIPAEAIGRMAAEKLLEAGHRRIAYCASQRSSAGLGYERGFRLVLSKAGVELRDEHVFYGNMTTFHDPSHYQAYEKDFESWFDRVWGEKDTPSAIFTSFESLGDITYLSTLRRGLRIPEDLSLVAVGGKERRGAIGRRLTCVTLDEEQTGQLTVQLLDEMCREKRAIDNDENFPITIGFDHAQTLGRIE